MYDLTIKPAELTDAINTLAAWINERRALLVLDEKTGTCKVTSAIQAVQFMDALYRTKEQVQELFKTPLEAAYDTLRFTIVPKLMTDEEISSVNVAGVGRVNLQDDVQVKVLNQLGLRDWLVANDLEDMIKPTVNAQTLAAFVRRRIKDGTELPGDVEVKPIVRAVITRAGQGE